MIECMNMHVQYDPDSRLSGFFQRKTEERGRKKAVVAGGRKMLRIIYYILRDDEVYHSGLGLKVSSPNEMEVSQCVDVVYARCHLNPVFSPRLHTIPHRVSRADCLMLDLIFA